MIQHDLNPNLGAQAHGTELKPLLTLDQVAEMLGISKAWVRDHATRRNPRIPVVRFGDRRAVLRFRPQDVEQFIADNLLPAGGVQ